jgi:hypothetical protein
MINTVIDEGINVPFSSWIKDDIGNTGEEKSFQQFHKDLGE